MIVGRRTGRAHLRGTRHLVTGLTGQADRSHRHLVPTLQTADVVHHIPAIHFPDTVIGRHQPAPVAHHPPDVAVSVPDRVRPRAGDVHPGHAVLGRRPVAEAAIAMTDGAVDGVVLVAVVQ